MRIKPFLKWAGGKYRLLDSILAALPQGSRLVEPFAGSATVSLNAPFQRILACDLNADLIALYTALQSQGNAFIAFCQSFFRPENNRNDVYYELRERFNRSADAHERAALLLYLNRHGYNGLVRYNSRGEFNVPFGRHAKPYFPLAELLAFCRRAGTGGVHFAARDFRQVFAELQPGDVVYCDPPYVPLSGTANFTAYAGGSFSFKEQQELARLAAEAGSRGIPVLLSNHDTDVTRSLYSTAKITRFEVRRFISRDAGGRGLAPELLAVYG